MDGESVKEPGVSITTVDEFRHRRLSPPARDVLAQLERNGGTLVLRSDEPRPELVASLQELRNAGYLRAVRAFELVRVR